MKKKKEYLVLIALIVALGLYLGLRTRDRTHFELPQPVSVETGAIDRLTITRPAGSLELAKKDTHWIIEPKGYRADEVTVKNMLHQLGDLTITALVSEAGSYERYALDAEKRITVQAYAAGQKKRDLAVGRPAPTQQHTFIKLEGDPNVYHVRGNLQNTFDKELDALRDKVVLAFDRDNLTAIEIRKNGQTALLAKNPPAEGTQPAEASTESAPQPALSEWQAEGGRKIDQAALDQLLSAMSQLKCEGYFDAPGAPRPPVWEVTFTVEGRAHRLSLFAPAEGDNRFAATSSDSPYDFWLPEARVKTLEQHLDQLLDRGVPKAAS